MSSRVVTLSKTYIVYKFYEEDRNKNEATDKFFIDYKIVKLPTILVFQNGKVTKRFEGVTEISRITFGVKTRKEQDWWRLW